MTAPAYNTDLTDFEDFEAASTVGTEVTGYTATAKGEDQDSDYPIQGSQHASAEQRTTGNGSLVSDYGSNVSWTSGDNFFMWGTFLAPAAVNSDANAGIEMMVGSAITAFHRWTVGGNDFGRYPYGGWQNFVVNPEISAGRTTVGTPGTNYRWVGMLCDVISAISKGSPYGIDVIRYGRGELEVTFGESADYGTFDGMATENDAQANKWGLFSYQSGSYLWKGLISLGTASTAVDFRDANRNIVVDNSRRVLSTFNKIEVNNASSNVEWINIAFTSLCSTSPGDFEAVADATISFDTCQFSDMGTFVFQSNSTLIGTTFRRCGQLTQDDADISTCVFTNSTAAVSLLVSDLDLVYDCDFISDGSNHAIELTSAHAAGSFDHVGITYTGYASTDGSTGNECIYNNSGGAVTINVSGGDTPTIRNGTGASTTVVAGAVTVKVIAQTAAGTKIENARVFLFASGTGPFPSDDVVTITNSGTTATVAHTAHGLATNDKIHIRGASIVGNNGVFSVTVTGVNAYTYTLPASEASSPTGTIYATFALLYGLTNASGEISMSRVFSSNQDVSGWARKSTGAPFYKTGPLSGTVDSGSGATFTAILSPDQ